VAGPKIIAMTASALKDDWEMCLAAGMDGYISKPTRIGAIREALEACSKKGDDLEGTGAKMHKSGNRGSGITIRSN
jgi:CheY-like chemotaxis protein